MPTRRVPTWVKLAYSAFVVILVPFYWVTYSAWNFVYFCDLALRITGVVVWIEGRPSSLVLGGVDAAQLGAVHALEHDEVAARIEHSMGSTPATSSRRNRKRSLGLGPLSARG